MSISYSFLTRFFRKQAKTVNGADTLEVNRRVIYTGGAHNLTLPSAARIGDTIEIVGNGSGVFTIKQVAGQSISHLTSTTTTGTGGSLAAGTARDCITLVSTSDNGTTWKTVNTIGTFTVA